MKKRDATSLGRYLLFHKPYGVLCQFTDDGGRITLRNFISEPGVYPCGRLDWDSEGLLLLTDDGPLIHQLSHPTSKAPKAYWVQVEGKPGPDALNALRAGVMVEGKKTLPAGADLAPEAEKVPPRDPPIRVRKQIPTTWIKITLKEGRNRQVRRMTAAVGHPTLRLIRISIGPFCLADLPSGQSLKLTAQNVQTGLKSFDAHSSLGGNSR